MIGDAFWEAKNIIQGNKITKSASIPAKPAKSAPLRFNDVRSYKAPADKTPSGGSKIEGIFYDPEGKSYVVVGGQLLSEGESIGKMAVKKISPDAVEVQEDGQIRVLKVNP